MCSHMLIVHRHARPIYTLIHNTYTDSHISSQMQASEIDRNAMTSYTYTHNIFFVMSAIATTSRCGWCDRCVTHNGHFVAIAERHLRQPNIDYMRIMRTHTRFDTMELRRRPAGHPHPITPYMAVYVFPRCCLIGNMIRQAQPNTIRTPPLYWLRQRFSISSAAQWDRTDRQSSNVQSDRWISDANCELRTPLLMPGHTHNPSGWISVFFYLIIWIQDKSVIFVLYHWPLIGHTATGIDIDLMCVL